MFRLNFSHGSHEYHLETLNNIRKAMKNVGKNSRYFTRYFRTKSKNWRFKRAFELFRDDVITFLKDEIVGYKKADKEYVVSINYPDILGKVKIDEYIYLYDGTIRAKVIEVGDEVKAKIENHGILSSRKG